MVRLNPYLGEVKAMALENILSVVTGKRIVSSCEAKLTDIDLFASFTVKIDDKRNLWEVRPRKYGDSQLDRRTTTNAEDSAARLARVQALADAATFIQEYYGKCDDDDDDDDTGEEKPSIFDLVGNQS